MRGTTPLAALALATALAGTLQAAPAAAQSDLLLQARSGSPAGDRFRVDSAGGVVAMSTLGVGVIPASGAGDRMMWHPFKAAFRAGSTTGGAGTEWNDTNVGFYSWAGGSRTIASGNYSFAMGNLATASAQSAVALGDNVTANANHSTVLGQRATAGANAGSFTWADASTTTVFSNTAAHSFQIRAAGGVRLLTNSAATVGVSLNSGGSSWNVVSDRNRKRDFAPVDGEDVLARIRNLPVTTWAYVDEAGGVRHMGPMAQDWHAAFGFSGDDTTINMSDLDGVNLAAVQALERRTADLQAQLAERDARIRALEARMARLEALLAAGAERPGGSSGSGGRRAWARRWRRAAASPRRGTRPRPPPPRARRRRARRPHPPRVNARPPRAADPPPRPCPRRRIRRRRRARTCRPSGR